DQANAARVCDHSTSSTRGGGSALSCFGGSILEPPHRLSLQGLRFDPQYRVIGVETTSEIGVCLFRSLQFVCSLGCTVCGLGALRGRRQILHAKSGETIKRNRPITQLEC